MYKIEYLETVKWRHWIEKAIMELCGHAKQEDHLDSSVAETDLVGIGITFSRELELKCTGTV